MPKYNLECLEKFVVKTYYYNVEGDSIEDALKKVKNGGVAYDDSEIREGDEEFISLENVEVRD